MALKISPSKTPTVKNSENNVEVEYLTTTVTLIGLGGFIWLLTESG
jgi:hypothetical protein